MRISLQTYGRVSTACDATVNYSLIPYSSIGYKNQHAQLLSVLSIRYMIIGLTEMASVSKVISTHKGRSAYTY